MATFKGVIMYTASILDYKTQTRQLLLLHVLTLLRIHVHVCKTLGKFYKNIFVESHDMNIFHVQHKLIFY